MRFLIALLLMTSVAWAKPKVVVLELVPIADTKGVDPKLIFLASELSDELREAAGRDFEVVSSADSEQVSEARECHGKKPACFASFAKDIGAAFIIYGVVSKQKDGKFVAAVKIQKGEKVLQNVTETLPPTMSVELVDLLAKQFLLKLQGKKVPVTDGKK
jgi:hypothetical protein